MKEDLVPDWMFYLLAAGILLVSLTDLVLLILKRRKANLTGQDDKRGGV